MRSYVAVSIFAFSASVFSAPTPQLGLGNVVGSVTGTASGTVGSLASTVGKTVDPVTGLVTDDADLKGVTGLVKEKRQPQVVDGLTRPVADLTKPVTDIVGDVTKVRVVGNARRQLRLPVVGGVTSTVDRVTDSVNLGGAVEGVKTDVHSKRQVLDLDSTTKSVDGLTGLNSNELTADATHNQVVDADKLLQLDIGLKRGIPVVQDLPVGGGVSGIVDNVPVVGGVTDAVESVTGDLNPVTELVYDAAQPVTDATEALNVRAPILDEVEVSNLAGDVNVPVVKDLPVVSDI